MNYKRIIPVLIAILGFTSSCDKNDDEKNDQVVTRYGIPNAKYQQKSNVEQAEFIDNEAKIVDEQ